MNHQIIVFQLGEQTYGIDIKKVSEISELLPLTPLPQSTIEGIVDFRGSVYSVISLRKVLGLEHNSVAEKRLIVLSESKVALLADDVTDMVTIEEENLQDAKTLSIFEENKAISYITEWNDRLITVINVDYIVPKVKAVSAS